MVRPTTIVLALALVAVTAACGSDPNDASNASGTTTPGATATPAPLEATTWILTSGSLDVPGVDQFAPSAVFASGRIMGSAGCNTYSGAYTASNGAMTISELLQTQMSCGPVADAIETAYTGRLGKVAKYAIVGDTLTLADSSGSTLLTFKVSTFTLEGSWDIIGYLTSSGTAFTSAIVSTKPTAVFGPDGSLSGDTGCNTYTGTYQVTGDAIKIGPLATTRKACDGDLATQETAIVAGLQTATRFTVSAKNAALFNGAGQQVVGLAKS